MRSRTRIRAAALAAAAALSAAALAIDVNDAPAAAVQVSAVVAPEVGVALRSGEAEGIGTVDVKVTREWRGGVEVITVVPQR
ncbi:MAG: hypothetical protein ACJ76Z_10705 [Thermoleophilaceae bacterium]